MYIEVPTNEFAMEFMSSPETPKSHSLISPDELRRMLDGLMSVYRISRDTCDTEETHLGG